MLSTVTVVAHKRTSLLAIAVATLFGAVGALASVAMMTIFEAGIITRLLPICQAGAIGVLLPACWWVIEKTDTTQPPK